MIVFKKILLTLLVLAFFVFLVSYYFLSRVPLVEPKRFGVTFSEIQAEHLKLDWKLAYEAIFADLKIKEVRIPLYWPEIEKEEGVFDFSDIDWMLAKAAEYNGRVILVVGRRVPRWPECFEPKWLLGKSEEEKEAALLVFVKKAVQRYAGSSVIWAWQVENEPFLNFGECPKLNVDFFDKEISLVRSIVKKPIIVTDSGEMGTWWRAYKRADVFGTTMYRKVYNSTLGYITYPIPPWYFRLKKGIMETIFGKKPSLVIELQAEAWGPKQIYEVSTEENYKSFNPNDLKNILEYIKGTGFDTFYWWGEEWWYWLKENGRPEMWKIVKEAIK